MEASLLEFYRGALSTLMSPGGFGDITDALVRAAGTAMRCEAASILEVNPREGVLFFRAATGRAAGALAPFRVPLGQGVAGHVAETGMPLVVSNAAENAVHLKMISEAIRFPVRDIAVMPIRIRGTCWGVLEALNREEGTFDSQAVAAFKEISGAIAQVLEARMMLAWAASAPRKVAA